MPISYQKDSRRGKRFEQSERLMRTQFRIRKIAGEASDLSSLRG
jgi:hypothetical protein